MNGAAEYVESIHYVVCPRCGSHILLNDREAWIDHEWDEWDLEPRTMSFYCDWWPCSAEFDAVVASPYGASTGGGDRP